jgi:hypothetical protein
VRSLELFLHVLHPRDHSHPPSAATERGLAKTTLRQLTRSTVKEIKLRLVDFPGTSKYHAPHEKKIDLLFNGALRPTI